MINQIVKRKMNKKGFTLIELIIVIAIIGILAFILVPRFGGFQDRARSRGVMLEARQIQTAMTSLHAEGATITKDAIKKIAFDDSWPTGTSENDLLFDTNGGFVWRKDPTQSNPAKYFYYGRNSFNAEITELASFDIPAQAPTPTPG